MTDMAAEVEVAVEVAVMKAEVMEVAATAVIVTSCEASPELSAA
jgi:hypothetical protein